MTSHGQCPRGGGGVLVKNPVSAPGPPPFKNPGSAPATTSFTIKAGRSRCHLPCLLVLVFDAPSLLLLLAEVESRMRGTPPPPPPPPPRRRMVARHKETVGDYKMAVDRTIWAEFWLLNLHFF